MPKTKEEKMYEKLLSQLNEILALIQHIENHPLDIDAYNPKLLKKINQYDICCRQHMLPDFSSGFLNSGYVDQDIASSFLSLEEESHQRLVAPGGTTC